LAASQAWADGDPASDVLSVQPLYLPADAGITPAQQAQLNAVMTAARRSGLAIRVALIAGPADLGSVSELWPMPERYAEFLGTELSLVFHGTLLVAMPDGFGLAQVGAPTSSRPPSLSDIRPPPDHTPLAAAASSAVQELAAATGHPLRLGRVTVRSSSGSALESVDAGSWIALGIGATLIALCWTASLWAKPWARVGPTR